MDRDKEPLNQDSKAKKGNSMASCTCSVLCGTYKRGIFRIWKGENPDSTRPANTIPSLSWTRVTPVTSWEGAASCYDSPLWSPSQFMCRRNKWVLITKAGRGNKHLKITWEILRKKGYSGEAGSMPGMYISKVLHQIHSHPYSLAFNWETKLLSLKKPLKTILYIVLN